MPAIISEKFRIFNAKQFIESFTEAENTVSWFFVGRPQRWDSYLEIYSLTATAINVGDVVYVGSDLGSATFRGTVREVYQNSLMLYDVTGTPTVGDVLKVSGVAVAKTGIFRFATDDTPPYPSDNQSEKYNIFDDIIAAKKISADNVSVVVPRYNFSQGSVYDMWKPDYSGGISGGVGKTTSTGFDNLYGSSKYYAMTNDFRVWMCIQNSGGTTGATDEPVTSGPNWDSSTGIYTQSDGVYSWKFMYKIDTNEVVRFMSSEFIPVIKMESTYADWANYVVVDGAIYAYTIEDEGAGLTDGTYYAPVNGDGTGAIAKITISGGEITQVLPYAYGTGYTYGSIKIAAGTGSGADAIGFFTDASLTTSGNPGNSAASIEVIIPPQGGYASDAQIQLNGKRIMTNVRIAADEGSGDFPVDNDFRRIGIVQDLYSGGALATDDTLSGLITIRITGNASGAAYTPDEVVTQDLGNSQTAKGTVVSWSVDVDNDNAVGTLKIFQSPEYHLDNGVVRSFSASSSNPVINVSNTTTGTIDAGSGGVTPSEIDNNKGDVVYIENRRLITRSADQIEDIKLVVEF